MRLGSKRRICIRTNRVNKRKFSFFLLLIFLLVLLMCAALYFLKTVRPVMTEIAKSNARFLAIGMVDEAVEELLQTETIRYSDIITLEKDENGKICAIQSNLVGVSRLKAKLAPAIQEKIANLSKTRLTIPAGSLSGIDFLAGVGPDIPISLLPYGNSQTEFLSSFESAGINQTRLCVSLHVKMNLALLMPTLNTACVVEDTIPILQTVIVGDIPDSYLNVDRDGGSLTDDVLELAPTD